MSERTDETGAARDVRAAEEVRRLSHDWVTAFVGRDAETLRRVMADDFAFSYPLDGDDREQFIFDVTSGDLTAEIFDRRNVNVRVHGRCAVLTCHDTATWGYKGRIISGEYRTLQVYAERDGRWQLVAVQSCPIPH